MNVVNQAFTVDDFPSEKGQAVKLVRDVTIRLREHQNAPYVILSTQSPPTL